MIDRRKNMLYVITVPYDQAKTPKDFNGYKYQKFISLHSIMSKRFRKFSEKYFEKVLGIMPYQIGEGGKGGDISLGTQETISLVQWQDAAVRERVMEGITELEKCY